MLYVHYNYWRLLSSSLYVKYHLGNAVPSKMFLKELVLSDEALLHASYPVNKPNFYYCVTSYISTVLIGYYVLIITHLQCYGENICTTHEGT